MVLFVAIFFGNIAISGDLDETHINYSKNTVPCSVSREDLQNTASYQALSCVQRTLSICQIGKIINDFCDNEGDWLDNSTGLLCTCLVFLPINHLIERVLGTITMRLARGRVINNPEILGLILFFEERMRVSVLVFATEVAGSLLEMPLVEAAPLAPVHIFPESFNGTVPVTDPHEFQFCNPECSADLARNNNYDIAVNLVFINPRFHTTKDGWYFIGSGSPKNQLADFNTTIVQPIVEVAHQNPYAAIIFWLDEKMMSAEVFMRSQQLSCQLLRKFNVDISRVFLRSIRELPEVKAAPEVFSSEIPVYWRCDIARILAALFAAEEMGVKNSFYQDLDMRIGASKALLTEETLSDLEKFGIIFADNGLGHILNGLFVLRKDVGLRTQIVERAIDWIKNNYVDKNSEGFVYECTYLWWAFQFCLNKSDMKIVDELKNNWSVRNMLLLLNRVNLDKYNRFFDVVDVQKQAKKLPKDKVLNEFFGEDLKQCADYSSRHDLSQRAVNSACVSLMIGWHFFLPMLTDSSQVVVNAPRREY